MEAHNQMLKIPKERVAIVIGKSGLDKKQIEQKTHTKIQITKDGEVTISSEESLNAWNCRQIIKAIGRGFSPDAALLLTDENFALEIIELKEWVGKNENAMKRLKGRVIGEAGKSKTTIEDLTETYISIYGKTISIIGEAAKILAAKKAIEMLLDGSRHATVFRLLETERRKWRINKPDF
jgi:ribosomal RNA assembly protein